LSYSVKHPTFNRDAKQFSWSKSKMYSHIICVYDELWDIIEDGVSYVVDHEGVMVDRKSIFDVERKTYKKHHIVRGILVEALPH